jgi:phospholipase C
VSIAGIFVATACSPAASITAAAPAGLNDIQHIVVVYLENWSFDSLYGRFPGADGLAGAGRTTQVDNNGVPYPRFASR